MQAAASVDTIHRIASGAMKDGIIAALTSVRDRIMEAAQTSLAEAELAEAKGDRLLTARFKSEAEAHLESAEFCNAEMAKARAVFGGGQ